jgi:DNA mismatch repair protein MutS
MAKSSGELTPLMKQYWDIKAVHEDKILLFRMGDFFEIFHEDAQTAAPILGIALTMRNKKSVDQTPMCGVPHHAIAGPINKLLAHGFKVAICDQIEDPKLAKGIVKRAVTRILSPGMVYDPETLESDQFNYICSVDKKHVSFLEPTTGECFFYKVGEVRDQVRLIETIAPVELVASAENIEIFKSLLEDRYVFSVHTASEEEWLSPFPSIECIRCVASYAVSMQGEDILKTLSPFEEREYESRLQLGPDVLRHLEIFRTYKGDIKGTIYEAINNTLTAGGSRRLKQWMCFPLRQQDKIEARLDKISYWLANTDVLKKIRSHLRGVGDLERKIGKISHPNSHPRDIAALALTFKELSEILVFFKEWEPALKKVQFWEREIDRILEENLPLQYRDGGMICRGVSDELDELIELSTNTQGKVLELEVREKELTQIPSLKVRYNNVFGFYIEITHTHTAKVPLDRYQRKQTLTNAERYTTDELVELERKVISARTRRAELEVEIYQRLKKDILLDMGEFLKIANFCSELDVITGLSWLALEKNYCRPRFSSDFNLTVASSRHPVVERTVSFVPNDIKLIKNECLLLTGPNMAGKSTLMRQVAVVSILAQMGSFVPAAKAELPLFDRIFTRIGASDFLAEGLSTFMVEMKETAQMLKEATENSLVILDEVGRGTSTYDGLSLAQSILEYLIGNKKPLVLFATHYHELTRLSEIHPNLVNAHMAIHEDKGQLQFLYTLLPGPAVRSYGIQVARLAGLPTAVTKRAEALLKKLESTLDDNSGVSVSQLDLFSQEPAEPEVQVVTVTDPKMELMRKEMQTLAIQSMTPLDALNKLAQWQQELS